MVLGNVGDAAGPGRGRVLASPPGHDDPLLRAHAVWAARRLGREDLLADLIGADDPLVGAELVTAVPVR